jgi:hypothetical protein
MCVIFINFGQLISLKIKKIYMKHCVPLINTYMIK